MTLSITYPISGFTRTFKNMEQRHLNQLVTQLSRQTERDEARGQLGVGVIIKIEEDEAERPSVTLDPVAVADHINEQQLVH